MKDHQNDTTLDDTTLTTEVKYPINFTLPNKRFVWSLNYNGNNSSLFVNATKIDQFKVQDSEIKDYALCLGNISKYFTINNFSFDFDPIDTNNILDIHWYLLKGK